MFIIIVLISTVFTLVSGFSASEKPRLACAKLAAEQSTVLPQILRTGKETESLLWKMREQKAEAINEGLYEATQGFNINARVSKELETVHIFSKPEMAKEPDFVMLSLAGAGAKYSQAESRVRNLTYYGLPQGKKRSLSRRLYNKQLRDHGEAIMGRVHGIDLPQHGAGIAGHKVRTPSQYADYIAKAVELVREGNSDKPFVYDGRSATAGYQGIAFAKKYSHLVDAFVLMSPTKPDPILNRVSDARLGYWDRTNPKFTLNKPGLNWSNGIRNNTSWDLDFNFGAKPVLILTGSRDQEMSSRERKFYKKLAQKHPNVWYFNIENAGHDVLAKNEREGYSTNDAFATLMLVNRFLRSVIHEQSIGEFAGQ